MEGRNGTHRRPVPRTQQTKTVGFGREALLYMLKMRTTLSPFWENWGYGIPIEPQHQARDTDNLDSYHTVALTHLTASRVCSQPCWHPLRV